MREMQRIKRIIIPLLKGLPIILITLLISLLIAQKAIQYSVPKYQSIAKIKLDDRKYGLSGNNLYEDFDVFSSQNKIETEAEILKSPLLIGKTVDAIDLNVMVTRIGIIKETILFHDNPFIFEYDNLNSELFDKKFFLNVVGDHFIIQDKERKQIASSCFGEAFNLNEESLTIYRNTTLLNKKSIETDGDYQFEIKSRNEWIAYLNGLIDVKAIDKEIPVLRIVIKSENAQFSADFANKLCDVYVDDYIYTKSIAAAKTLSFIDERMTDLRSVLANSENSLERYKIDHKVVNTLQETETGLREMSKLQLQLINLEMEEQSITELDTYMSQGDYYEKTAINFGFGDLVLTELVKKLKLYTDEKRDLLMKYTLNDQHVINVQEKINDIENYIKEAIHQNKKNIQIKRTEIEASLKKMESQFDDIPTREKEMRILERDFQINEAVYTFLAQKKLEAQIASSALMSFHRVIQPATPAIDPISPNKVLITFVCGFMGLFAGIVIVFGSKLIRGRIQTKSDIEKLTSTPVLGVLTKAKKGEIKKHEFVTLATALSMHSLADKQTIIVTSSTRREGKTFIAKNLAETYAKMGFSVTLLDINFFNPSFINEYDYLLENLVTVNGQIEQLIPRENEVTKIGITNTAESATLILAHKQMAAVMTKIKSVFDYVIIDTPGAVISIDALCMLKYADLCLYTIRTKVSKAQYIPNVDAIQADFGFDKMQIILNGAHSSTNYSGNFNGSQLHYAESPKGVIQKLKYYISIYAK